MVDSATASLTVKVAWPFVAVVPVTVVIVELPPLLASVTVLPLTGLLLASLSVTVIVEVVELSAGTEVGFALTVDVPALTAPAFTVSCCVAEVMVVGEVLAAVIVGVPAFVSVYVNVALLEPLAIDKLVGLNVTVPLELLVNVTVLVASAVTGFPDASCRCTVIVPDATPAVTVTGVLVNTNFVAAAAAVTVSCCVAEVMVVGEVLAAVIVGVPACVSVYVKLALLDPLPIDKLVGLNVTVPPELLDSVTVLAGSVVFGLLY